MRVGLMIEGQEDVTWEEWRALARACEEHGVESLFRSDHYLSVDGHGGGAERFLEDLPESSLAGTLDVLTARLGQLAEAGVERVMLQHLLHRDLDAVEQIGRRAAPTVRGGAAAWPAAGRPARRPR